MVGLTLSPPFLKHIKLDPGTSETIKQQPTKHKQTKMSNTAMESQPKYPDPSKKSGCYTIQIKDIDILKWKQVNNTFYRDEDEELEWNGKEPDQCKMQRHGASLAFTQHANGTFMV